MRAKFSKMSVHVGEPLVRSRLAGPRCRERSLDRYGELLVVVLHRSLLG
jgi:hypothetical protein